MLLPAFLLLATSVTATPSLTTRASGCKCTASDPCWPSESEWATLSATLTHPVFNVVPPGYYCHDPNYNAELCSVAQANIQNPLWITDQPGGSLADNWEFNSTSWCYIVDSQTNPCGQGRVPSVAVNATSVEDLQATVTFAAQHNLKVHVKSTGHDFLGRSLGPGSLLIWTHYWTGTSFSSDFVHAGGQTSGVPAITVQPGTQWYEAYQFASDNGVTIAGAIGGNASIGAGGGWSLGGGHNILSPTLDLGADNAIEVSVVLPNGTYVTANAYQNTDLFWAIRGGGGPSLGIVTSLTFKVYPQFPVYAVFFEATTTSSAVFVNLLDSFHSKLPSLAQAGWSGYYPFSTNYLALIYLLPNGTDELASSTLVAWIDEVAQISGVSIQTNTSVTYPNFEAWLVANILEPADVVGFNYPKATALGVGAATASWLLPTNVFTDTTTANQLSQAMANMNGGIVQHVAGGVVSSHPGDYNALHPAWREALVDLVIFAEWSDGTSSADILAARQNVTNMMAPVRALTPDNPAQYLNEPDILLSNFSQVNWGTNYARLLSIKEEIDPDNMFLVLQGVNSENWDSEQICPL